MPFFEEFAGGVMAQISGDKDICPAGEE